MTRPRRIQELLGTSTGDQFLSDPRSANDLYRSLVGTPSLDSLQAAIGAPSESAAPWEVFDPNPEPEEPDGPTYVCSEREPTYYSSRDHNPGVGYPSCSRAMARVAKRLNDPNGYYRLLGVRADASRAEIRRALEKQYMRLHPDTGWDPNVDEFMFMREIAKVLLDDKRRDRYDNLAPGEHWVDSKVRKRIEDENPIVASMDSEELSPFFKRVEQPEEEVINDLRREDATVGDGGVFRQDRHQAMKQADQESGNDHYDWFSDGEWWGDRARAQLWYHHLHSVAPMFRYTRPMRVWLQDGGEPSWSDIGGILRIPRSWKIGRAEAYALFSVVVR